MAWMFKTILQLVWTPSRNSILFQIPVCTQEMIWWYSAIAGLDSRLTLIETVCNRSKSVLCAVLTGTLVASDLKGGVLEESLLKADT